MKRRIPALFAPLLLVACAGTQEPPAASTAPVSASASRVPMPATAPGNPGDRPVPPPPPPSPAPPSAAAAPPATAGMPSPLRAYRPAPTAPQLLPPPETARYTAFSDNPWQRVAETPVSTFSANVDTASYSNLRRFLNQGRLPPRDAVRVEELLNYFEYEDPQPRADGDAPFAVSLQMAASPWNAQRGLLRIGIQARNAASTRLPPANLVFLVDVSGSMGPADRLPLVRNALLLLAAQLRAEDRVSLVTYANGTKLVLPATPGDQKERIRAAIESLQAGGGTYGESGIRMAYAQAREGFVPGGINRVLLATDGDLNIGVTNPDQLKELVVEQRRAGVALSTLGVGGNNYNDALLKKLANAGDGSHHYLDSLQEAHKVLVRQMRAALDRVALDLKLQIEFNPAVADEYRLIGYELSGLKREDFNNDQVDAGDIGAGHSVTALYEWVPRGTPGNVDPLRYQPGAAAGASGASGAGRATAAAANRGDELAWLKLRFKRPGQGQSELMELPVRPPRPLPAMAQAPSDLRFAAAVAGWGQWLRGSTQVGDYGVAQARALAQDARGADPYGQRAEALQLMELSASLRR